MAKRKTLEKRREKSAEQFAKKGLSKYELKQREIRKAETLPLSVNLYESSIELNK